MNISPTEADPNQEMFDFTPSPFSIKEACILTQARWFFRACSSQFAGFPNKVVIPCLLIIGLLCSEQYKLRLGNRPVVWFALIKCLLN